MNWFLDWTRVDEVLSHPFARIAFGTVQCRDDGILDYHPAFGLPPGQDGFILYPHFYPYIVPGWFDKNAVDLRVIGRTADRIILLAPSNWFVTKLPFGRILYRRDFVRLRGRRRNRVNVWEKASNMGWVLGDIFLEATATGRIREMVRPPT